MQESKFELALKERLGLLAGEASMCWNPRPGSQVFNSTEASVAVDKASCDILNLVAQELEQVLEEAADWKDEYFNLCRFADHFQDECVELKWIIKGLLKTSREHANDYEYGDEGYYYWEEIAQKALRTKK